MYLLNEILLFGPGRRQEAIDRLTWIFGLFAPHSGFRRAILAKHLGDTTRHAVLRFWDREEDFTAFRGSPEGGYGKSKPPGIYEGEHVVTPLTTVGEAAGQAEGNFLAELLYDIGGTDRDEFLAWNGQVLKLIAGEPGFVWGCQSHGRDEAQALTIVRFRSRDEFEKLVDGAEYCALAEAPPAGTTDLGTKCFEVIRDGLPKP